MPSGKPPLRLAEARLQEWWLKGHRPNRPRIPVHWVELRSAAHELLTLRKLATESLSLLSTVEGYDDEDSKRILDACDRLRAALDA